MELRLSARLPEVEVDLSRYGTQALAFSLKPGAYVLTVGHWPGFASVDPVEIDLPAGTTRHAIEMRAE
ncbi:MAG: hypothetical protein R3F17_15565 [Planctomycetota bacterium]